MSSAQAQIARRAANGPIGATRKWSPFAAAAALMILLATGSAVVVVGSNDIANAALERAKSFIELIQKRSPGARTKAQLVKIKQKRVALHQRALPKVRQEIPILPPGPPSLFEIVAPPIPMKTASLQAIEIPPLLEQSGTPPGLPFFVTPSLVVPPSTTTETPTTPPIVQPPVSAVPEPGTWATMLLGFGLIGWRLRHRRRQVQVDAG